MSSLNSQNGQSTLSSSSTSQLLAVGNNNPTNANLSLTPLLQQKQLQTNASSSSMQLQQLQQQQQQQHQQLGVQTPQQASSNTSSNPNTPPQSKENGNNGATASANGASMSGYLMKWTNYLKGYQKRWFVLNEGLLSYYRSQAEMAHTCRGTIKVGNAIISSEDACHFVVTNLNCGTTTFHLKAANEMEKQKWVSAIELAKSRAKQYGNDSGKKF